MRNPHDPEPTAIDVLQRPPRSPRPSPLGAFVATSAGGLVVALDLSVANALTPAIGADFHGADRAVLSWLITGYAIAFAAVLVPAGRLADRLGRRRTYLGGLAVFALGSLVCGLAPGLGVLLLGRVIQGLGAAAASPASLGLLLATADERSRGLLAARWTGAAAVGVCLGPLVGGAMTDLGDWRWAFLVNLPVVAATASAARAVLPETPRHPGRGLPDPLGAAMLAGAAATLSLVLSESASWGLLSFRCISGAVVAGALAWCFVRRSSRVREPLLDLTLLRHRQVLSAAIVTGCYSAGVYGFFLTLPLFAIGHWHLSMAGAGATALAPGLVVVALTIEVGRVAEDVGHRVTLVTGACVMAASLVACATVLGGDRFQHRWLLVGPVLGVGIGVCYPVLAGAAVHGLARADLAAASAVNQCARQLGGVVGTAATVGVLGNDLSPHLTRIHGAWLLGAAFCAAAAVAAVLIPPSRGAPESAAAASARAGSVAEEASR